jgi:uncharacterized tellurite resistance protein B-like protein
LEGYVNVKTHGKKKEEESTIFLRILVERYQITKTRTSSVSASKESTSKENFETTKERKEHEESSI